MNAKDSLDGLIERVMSALKPFAEAADDYDPEEGDDNELAWLESFKVGDLRRARTTLRALQSIKTTEPTE